jgi:hypothetical protein
MRELKLIQDEIDAAVAADDVMSVQLTSTSRTAIWRLWRDVTALAIQTLEGIFDAHKKDVETIAARSEYGTKDWYGQKALEFQLGDVLTIQDGLPGYSVIDETKKIVRRASVSEGATGGLLLKVAKESSGLVPLTSTERSAFVAYLNKIKFAGIFTQVVSLPADLIKGTLVVYHNGLRLEAELETELDEVAANFVTEIPFDGRFSVIKFIDALQAVDGVTDVVPTLLQAKPSSDVYTAFQRVVDPVSGYFEIDTAGGGFNWSFEVE